MISEIPEVCRNCTKKGMDAINCPVFPTLKENIVQFIPCFRADKDPKVKDTSGGRYNFGLSKNMSGVRHASNPHRKKK